MRFHVLAVPHAVSTPEYSSCAFTQKVVKLCAMLKMSGHTVFHYGNEASVVECEENIPVTTAADLEQSYPGHDWRKSGWPQYSVKDAIYTTFITNTVSGIFKRKQPGDFLLLPFGLAHKPVADLFPDMIAVESGIGYPDGGFAQFRVFESYAVMHAYQGMNAVRTASNDRWYDVVIPNAFNLSDFQYSEVKGQSLLLLGRVNEGKGEHIARQIAEATKTKLIIAGGTGKDSRFVKYVGIVGPEKRAKLLSRAKALLTPSTFLEPFCGVQIEAMLSGTPVISSDRGAFAEYNIHGITGFRCQTFEHFTWAVNNISRIDPKACRLHGDQFSLDNVASRYDEYFRSVKNIFGGDGWYTKNPGRLSLDYTTQTP